MTTILGSLPPPILETLASAITHLVTTGYLCSNQDEVSRGQSSKYRAFTLVVTGATIGKQVGCPARRAMTLLWGMIVQVMMG